MQTLLTVRTDRPIENRPVPGQSSTLFSQAKRPAPVQWRSLADTPTTSYRARQPIDQRVDPYQIPKNQVAKYTGTKSHANPQSLEQHLLKSGLLNFDQLTVANHYCKSTGKNLSQVLDTLGWVRQEIVDDLADRLCLFNGAA